MPDVQNPHCEAPCSINDFCIECSRPFRDKPSAVKTFFPETVNARVRQARTGLSSSKTVHAPQSPPSQPRLGLVTSRISRKTSSNESLSLTITSTGMPFTAKFRGYFTGQWSPSQHKESGVLYPYSNKNSQFPKRMNTIKMFEIRRLEQKPEQPLLTLTLSVYSKTFFSFIIL